MARDLTPRRPSMSASFSVLEGAASVHLDPAHRLLASRERRDVRSTAIAPLTPGWAPAAADSSLSGRTPADTVRAARDLDAVAFELVVHE